MKGIILAGGKGTRLFPITSVLCKQLLPVYDKPMIYYPLSTLMLAGIREILIISTEKDIPRFKSLLGSGENIGLSLSYAVQKEPKGLAEAFIIGEDFIGLDSCALALGDNLFYGNEFSHLLQDCFHLKDGGIIFGYEVSNPSQYGVVAFDKNKIATSIEEKPRDPKSHFAVPGLYFYDNEVISIAKSLRPSVRGELEITDINNHYLQKGKLQVRQFSRGYAWLDTGTFTDLSKAAMFVQTIQERQGIKISCIEEISYRMGFITLGQLEKITTGYPANEYKKYLVDIVKRES